MHSRGSTEQRFYVRGLIKGGQWGHHIEKCARTPNSYTTDGFVVLLGDFLLAVA